MLMSPIVTLIVGPEGHETHEFTVHRDMLTQCKHFSQMFESSNFVGDASVWPSKLTSVSVLFSLTRLAPYFHPDN